MTSACLADICLSALIVMYAARQDRCVLHACRMPAGLMQPLTILMLSWQACTQQQLTDLLVNRPSMVVSWAPTLCRCFAFERSAAALLMYNTSQAGPHAAVTRPMLDSSTTPCINPSINPSADSQGHDSKPACPPHHQQAPSAGVVCAQPTAQTDSRTDVQPPEASANDLHEPRSPSGAASSSKDGVRQAPASTSTSILNQGAELGTSVLPRMPLGLKHITAAATYTAVAKVARTLGNSSLAAAGHESSSHSKCFLGFEIVYPPLAGGHHLCCALRGKS